MISEKITDQIITNLAAKGLVLVSQKDAAILTELKAKRATTFGGHTPDEVADLLDMLAARLARYEDVSHSENMAIVQRGKDCIRHLIS